MFHAADLVGECPRFERKGKTSPDISANGYMFSALNRAGEIEIRFSKEVQEINDALRIPMNLSSVERKL